MGNGKRILLVDDSKTQLVTLQMALKKMGFDVLTAADGIEGVSRAFLDQPDIIVSDIMMPELNGYQLCRLLKNDKKTSHIPIILLTSLDQPQDKFWGIRAGADRYIVKSRDISDLKTAIEEILTDLVSDEKKIDPKQGREGKSTDWSSIKSNVNRLLDKLLFESTLASEARQLANYIHAKKDLLKEVTDLTNSLIEYSCLCLCLFDRKGIKLYYDLRESLPQRELTKTEKHLQLMAEGESENANMETVFFEGSKEVDNKRTDKILSRFIVPLNIHNECIGYLSFLSIKPNAFAPKTENIIQLLAHDFSMVFKLMLLYEETKELAIKDGLTKLYNKRYFLESLEKEFVRAKRFNEELSLILLDIDHFKKVNDTLGHIQGDSVLKEIGTIIKQAVRKVDFAARYGGEEFVVIAPNTSLQEIMEIAERIRKNTEQYPFKSEKEPLNITISLGVATLTEKIKDKMELLKEADDALYQAKRAGRNQICIGQQTAQKKSAS